MMIAERERFHLLDHRLQVVLHLFWRCDAGEQQYVIVFRIFQLFSCEDALQCIVVDAGEVELLEWIEVHCLGEYTEFHWFQILRTFGDNHDVGTALSAQWFTQPSGRQHLVVDDETMVIYQENIDAWLDIAMLEGIIKQYHIYILGLFIALQVVDASYPFGIYCNVDIRKLLVHLERLITDIRHFCIFICKYISVALAFVST